MAFRGLQAESAVQGEAHRTVAKELKELVADPFAEWASGHKVRSTCHNYSSLLRSFLIFMNRKGFTVVEMRLLTAGLSHMN